MLNKNNEKIKIKVIYADNDGSESLENTASTKLITKKMKLNDGSIHQHQSFGSFISYLMLKYF